MTRERDFKALMEKYHLDLQPERSQLEQILPAHDVYEENFTWEQLFSKKADTDLLQIINEWQLELRQNLEQTRRQNEKNFRRRLEQMLSDMDDAILCYAFLQDTCLPVIMDEERTLAHRLEQDEEQAQEILSTIDDCQEVARGAKRFGGGRDESLDEYLDAVENYWGHLIRSRQNEAMHELLLAVIRFIQKYLNDIQQELEAQRLDEERKAAEAKRLDEERKAAEAKRLEEERLTSWNWVRELIQYGVLRILDSKTCIIYVTEAVPELPENASVPQLLALIRVYASGQIPTAQEQRISCSGSVAQIGDYLRKDEACAALCASELAKRKKLEQLTHRAFALLEQDSADVPVS
ncbi:MAG: hypothetical protein LUI87_19985 [Lachnospiraceae bacterium]|nr:hypothetical protein [Lachnospiraceae bacterium]